MRQSKPREPKPGPLHAIRPMRIADHGDVHRIWRDAEGIVVMREDSRTGIALYLSRNPGLCFVATFNGEIVGTVLCGHDGRRGILRHLAVKRSYRSRGIGRALAQACLRALSAQGIRKCNLYVMKDNASGMRFWRRQGYKLLDDDYCTLQAATK